MDPISYSIFAWVKNRGRNRAGGDSSNQTITAYTPTTLSKRKGTSHFIWLRNMASHGKFFIRQGQKQKRARGRDMWKGEKKEGNARKKQDYVLMCVTMESEHPRKLTWNSWYIKQLNCQFLKIHELHIYVPELTRKPRFKYAHFQIILANANKRFTSILTLYFLEYYWPYQRKITQNMITFVMHKLLHSTINKSIPIQRFPTN